MNRPFNPGVLLVLMALVGVWVASAVLTGPGRGRAAPRADLRGVLLELDRGELWEGALRTRDNSVGV